MIKDYRDFIPKEWDKPKFFEYLEPSYITLMGSRAYGTYSELSDYDFYGFIVPPVEVVFPHLIGHINGFGRKHTPFEQYQIQHAQHPEFGEVDVTIYNIVKYFQLVMDGNPNMVDSLFTLNESVVRCDVVGEMVRENRRTFLSELMYHRHKGMAWSHASRLKSGSAKEGRKPNVEKYGYDVKDAYHSIRILLQIKEILLTGDLDLQGNAEYLKTIRNGCYSLEYVLAEFDEYIRQIDEIVETGLSVVPYSPDEIAITELLLDCLEESYGSLSKFGYGMM